MDVGDGDLWEFRGAQGAQDTVRVQRLDKGLTGVAGGVEEGGHHLDGLEETQVLEACLYQFDVDVGESGYSRDVGSAVDVWENLSQRQVDRFWSAVRQKDGHFVVENVRAGGNTLSRLKGNCLKNFERWIFPWSFFIFSRRSYKPDEKLASWKPIKLIGTEALLKTIFCVNRFGKLNCQHEFMHERLWER